MIQIATRRYFISKIEMTSDDGEFTVSAKAVSDDPDKSARSVLKTVTRDPGQYTIGAEVEPVFVVKAS